MRKVLDQLRRRNSNLHIFGVVTAVVLVWRGLWGLMDLYLLPDNPTVSFLLSVIVGVVILYWLDRNSLKDLE